MQERTNLESNTHKLEARITEFEHNKMLLMVEIERLNLVVSDKNREVEIWKGQVPILNIEIEKLNSNSYELRRETESWRSKYVSLDNIQDSLKIQLESEIRFKLVYFFKIY